MSDDKNQTDSDLFDTEGSESSTDAASTTETENEELDLGEERANETLSKSKPIAPGEAQRQKMVDAWTLKVTEGEADLENLPAKQKWMKPLIEQKLGLQKKEAEFTQSADQIIEKKLAEKEEAKRFKDLVEFTKTLPLSERKAIAEKFKTFKARGLVGSDALLTAHEAIGVNREDDNSVLQKRMAIPETGNYTGSPVVITKDGELPTKEEDRLKLYAEMAKGR